MRRLLLTTTLICASQLCYAQTAPSFRPLDPSMQLTPPAAVMTAPTTTPTTSRSGVARNGEIIDSVGSNAIPALPLELVTANGISYLSGGIGDEEKAQLTAQEAQFNLRLLITGMNGEYLSNVGFTLKDDKGATLISLNDAGPFVYVALVPGNYTVEAVAPSGSGKAMPIKILPHSALKGQIRL